MISRIRSFGVCIVLSAMACASPALAQRAHDPFPRFAPTYSSAWGQSVPESPGVTFGHPDDYRWEGMIAGGVVLGVASLALTSAMCSDDSGGGCPFVVATVSGVTAGAVIGGLIGATIPKTPADSARAGP